MPENTKIMLRNVRASYVTVDAAKPIVEGGDAYYSVSIILDPTNPGVEEYKKVATALMNERKWTPVQIKNADKGLHNGDTEREGDEAYAGKLYVNAKSKQKPLLLDKSRREVGADKFYSGCYCNISIGLFSYDKAGRKGVGVVLRGMQFVEDGDPLGATVTADEFDQLDDNSAQDDFI